MPSLPNAASIVRVRVAGTVATQVFNNIFHLQYTGAAPSSANLNAVCSAVLTAWATEFSPICPSSVVLAEADAQDLTTVTSSVGVATNTTAGTRAGTSMPNSVACCITWKINVRYRGGHPRTYLPAGVIADVSSGNRWTDAFTAAVDAAAGAFLGSCNSISVGGNTYKLGALSYRRNNAPLVTPVFYPYVGNIVDHRPDTQRRRLGKDIAA